MENYTKNIHRGALLESVRITNGISITLLSKKAGYKNRSSYYTHKTDSDLAFEILFKYGKVLNYNFGEHFAEMGVQIMEEPATVYTKEPGTLQEAVKIINELKEKHYRLLEKYEQLMEKYQLLVEKVERGR